ASQGRDSRTWLLRPRGPPRCNHRQHASAHLGDSAWRAAQPDVVRSIPGPDMSQAAAAQVITRLATAQDADEIADLNARAFGPGRLARTAYRIREGSSGFSPFCRVCRIDGRLAAAVRFTPITIGGGSGALLLGPLAVEPAFASQG